MTREQITQALRAFGLTQAELARAAGVSEPTVSRQLAGTLDLSPQVREAAEELLTARAGEVGTRLLDWVEYRRRTTGRPHPEQEA